MMKQHKAILSAAAIGAALAVSSSVAVAQYRVGSDGRLNDANNRIGSNGYNTGGPIIRPLNGGLGNNVVTGNVTGGREFRGPVGYTDPGAFRGSTADETTDRFIRGSSGASFTGAPQNNAQNVLPFYGSSRAAPPPPGFVKQGLTDAYIPAPAMARQGSDLRLGSVVTTPQTVLPSPGDLMLPGPVNPSTGLSTITASPLYGVRQWRSDVPAERQFVDRFGQDQRPDAPDRMSLDANTLEQYRAELRVSNRLPETPEQDGTSNELATGVDLNRPRVGEGDATGANQQLANQPLANNALGGQIGPDQSTRQELMTPAGQSALYARLQAQFDQQGGGAITDQEAQRRFALQRNLQAKINAEAKAGKPGELPELPGDAGLDGGDTGAGAGAGAIDTSKLPMQAQPGGNGGSNVTTEPVKVNNLAEGTNAKGLAKLMTGAEEAMRAGEFGTAIDRYDAAASVAPNNPLVTLGRAHAELGASYYGRAEADLRKAFTNGPALLAGEYDLITFLGAERLQFVIKDLKEIASAEQQQAGPTFLLAYIARNMGNSKLAADYLTETEKRLGGPDPLIDAMRKGWRLPTADEAGK
ncbi:MAG TPA: hypothetical protein VGN72_23165 [Tepidisphaeraceae bacterium]|nr:hypothetical protein [Tepidisphaeraceae bacterium]